MFPFLVATIFLTVPVSGDVCEDLRNHLGLSALSFSYEKRGVCHGLFWRTSRGYSDICAHTTATARTCKDTHELFVSEARWILTRIGAVSTSVAPTIPYTTTVQVGRANTTTALSIPVFTGPSVSNTTESLNVCEDLRKHLGLSALSFSYEKRGVCHGLFWRTARGYSDICAHTTATARTCTDTHKLYISEARELLIGLKAVRTSVAPTTNISTTTVQATSTLTEETSITASADLSDAFNANVTTSAPTSNLSSTTVQTTGAASTTTEETSISASINGTLATMTTSAPTGQSNTTVGIVNSTNKPSAESDVIAAQVNKKAFEVLAFGDWGFQGHPEMLTPTAQVIASNYNYVKSIFLLGDNFYPKGISPDLGLDDPAFNLFRDVLAAASTEAKFYPVLGNHDYLGSVEAQLAYSHVNAQWVFPAKYYFQRFTAVDGKDGEDGEEGVQVCAWFLDTNKKMFDERQITWLDESISTEKATCDWLVVSGHHPVFDAGEYSPNEHLIANLLPILRKHQVGIYLSGHEHQSQVLSDGTTTFFIAGAAADIYNARSGHEYLQYMNSRDPAILRFRFSVDRADFEFIATHKRNAPVIHSGIVRRS